MTPSPTLPPWKPSLSNSATNLTTVGADAFDGLTALETLDLSLGGGLTTLDEDIFDGLTALETLNLSTNSLTTLDEDIFDGLTALETLNLGSNSLTTLDEDIFDGLTALATLDLSRNDLTTLPADVFAGLTSLSTLDLGFNGLTTLDADIFDGLTALIDLRIGGNSLRTLDTDIFDGLTAALEVLNLDDNLFTALPVDIFDGLTGLDVLKLSCNYFTTLDLDIFDPFAASLTFLDLQSDSFTTALNETAINAKFTDPNFFLSVGTGACARVTASPTSLRVAEGSTGMYSVALRSQPTGDVTVAISSDNTEVTVSPASLTFTTTTWDTAQTVTVSAAQDTDEADKSATMTLDPSGGGYDDVDDVVSTVLTVTVADDDGPGVTVMPPSLTIAEGSTGTYTVELNTQPTAQVTVAISTSNTEVTVSPTSLTFTTSNWNSAQTVTVTAGQDADTADDTAVLTLNPSGADYASVSDATVTVTVTDDDDLPSGICNRTAEVQTAILAALTGSPTCATVTDTQLASITSLAFFFYSNSSIPPADFAGLTGLTSLSSTFSDALTTVPDDAFTDLTALEYLSISSNSNLTTLGADAFDGLIALEILELEFNGLTALDEDIFDGLDSLEDLRLNGNSLTALDEDIFDGLTNLAELNLYGNDLRTLPADIFDGLTNLADLELFGNDLTTLDADIFDGLTNLAELSLSDNLLTTLDADIFDGLTNLAELSLSDNLLTTLDADIFDGLTNLADLELFGNDLTTLDADIFDGLTNLAELSLSDNLLTTLDADIFDGLSALTDLFLGTNSLTTLDADIFDGLTNLEEIQLSDNSLTALDANIFEGITQLESLQLQCNYFTVLDLDIFDPFAATLSYLDITSDSFTTAPTDAAIRAKFPMLTEGYTGATFCYRVKVSPTSLTVFEGATGSFAVTLREEPSLNNVMVTISSDNPEVTVSPASLTFTTTNSATAQMVTVTAAADSYEADKFVTLTLDPSGDDYDFTSSTALTVTIVEVTNSEPMFSTETATRTLPENSGAGVNVVGGVITATDSDGGDTLTYSLTGANAASFEIDSNGQLKTKTGVTHNFNFEDTGNNSFSVTVNVRDSKDPVGVANTDTDDTIAVTINLTNVDEPGTVSISGTLSGGSALTASLTDIDGTPTSVTWRWARGDTQNGSFTNIIGATSDSYTLVAADVGKYLRASVNYTDPQGSGKTANAVTSGGVSASNAQPMFSTETATRTLPENSGAGANVVGGAVTATDSDSGDTLTYSLTGADSGSFTIDSMSGQIKSRSGVTYNYEATKNSYTLTVNVRDSKDAAGDANTVTDDSITVTINLTNVNEAPVIASPPATKSIPENSTAVVTFTATDVDALDTRTWSLEPADDGGKFTINPSSGVLTFTNAPDFETPDQTGSTANEYKVTVKVTDAGGMSDTHTITVTVTNINEAPEITTAGFDYTELKADENTATTEVIQTYEASDADANSVLTWSLEGNDRADFTITKNADGHGELKFANVPNYEMPANNGMNNEYEVTVKVRDNHAGQLSDTLMVELAVNDVNEKPVVTGDAGPSFAEIEFDVHDADLSPTDYEVDTYTGQDEDVDAVITWSVSGTDSAQFDIDPMTGLLSFNTRPDFENPEDMADAMNRGASDNLYVIVVEATDELGSAGTFNVTVTVTNVNETPEITSNNATQTFAEIEYDATTANLEVDTFTGRDEETETISWSLGGTDMGDFSINSASGLLSFSQRPNYEMSADNGMNNEYEIIVKARDTTNNTRDYLVTVTVTDVNERPDINEDTVPSYMEIEYDFTGTRPDVHTFTATDYDAGDTFTWSLLGTDAVDLEIGASSGVLTFTQVPSLDVGPLPTFEAPQDDNADGSNTYNITVRATDNHGKTEDYDVVVTVTDVNEKPELTGSPVATVSYNENVTMDVATYTARDEESAMNTWSLTGTDRGRFSISTEGVVTFDPNTFADGPNYEDAKDSGGDNVYNFTVVVTDTQSGSSRRTASIDVTVTVEDVEEPGTITVSNLNPAVGETVTFTLEDPDGGIVSARWLIQRRPTESDPWVQLGTARETSGSTSYSTSYTADEDQTGRQVRAIVTSYRDRRGPDKEAESEPTAAITADPIVNAPPRFRSYGIPPIREGTAGDVGERLQATDRDNDTLTFGIQEGAGSEYFAIDPATGQTRTTQALDFESTSGFLELTVTLHDGRDADGNPSTDVDDTIDFAIFVIDVEEPGVVTLSAEEPVVGTPLQATLADGDGGVTGRTWRWSRSENGRTGWTNISGATSSTYTPKEEDGAFFLRAMVTYTDRRGGGKSAEAITSSRTPSENRRPTFPSTENGQRTVAENTRAGVSIGDPVVAEDTEDDTLVYTLVGTDAAAFTIVEGTGQLRTMEPLDFETKSTYTFTIEVHDGLDGMGQPSTSIDDTQSVTITLENQEEPGTVTLTTDTATIQARVEVTAELIDGDGPSGIDWQWSRSPNGRTGWVNISAARSARYTPTLGEDAGNYIRATATYTDGHGSNSKTANAVSPRVGEPPPVNSAPAFPSTENGQREVAENTDGEIGDPLEATDFNNDTLYYSLSGADAASFEINQNTGQLLTASNTLLDFEGKRSYRFTVEVSDRADQNGDPDMVIDDRQNVTITVTNVNEAPMITGDAAPSFEENSNSAVASYTGDDPERGTLTWTIAGSGFWISDRGQLYFSTPPSFEDGTTYTVVVTATDDGNLSDGILVNVTVTDAEEEGTITIEPPRGWDRTAFTTGLDDDDGNVSGETWQWERSSNRSSWQEISGATLDSYTATTADIDNYLRVTVEYTDRRGSNKEASAAVAGRIEDSTDRPSANNAPAFTETAPERSVGQGTAAGRNVGAPVRATDEDTGDVLTYSLDGMDAALFDIDPATGQILTRAVLDYDPDGTNTYSVEVRVHDGYGPDYQSTDVGVDATITVTITVTAVAQRSSGGGGGFGAAAIAPKFVDGFRTERPLAVTARPGDAVGDPVAATHPNDDDVTYSLSGTNAALFTVDEETGQIRLGQGATLEVGQTYTVNLTATDSTGTGAIIIVVIEVAEGVADPYDANGNGTIEKDEVLAAIADYFAGIIEKEEVLELVARYFAG